jgi:hypothetical protein
MTLTNTSLIKYSNADIFLWKSPKGESLLEYLWKSDDPRAMHSLLVITKQYSLNDLLQTMKNRFSFLDMVFNDPAVRKPGSMPTRRRIIYEILENARFSQLTFDPWSPEGEKFFKSFIAASPKRQFEYDIEFLEVVGSAMPFMFQVAGRNTTVKYPASRFFPKTYLGGMERKLWIDMLGSSLIYDRGYESTMMALQLIQSFEHRTKMGPESLTNALEYAIITENFGMFERTANLIQFLGDRGYRFEDTKWRWFGYNVLHLALIYGNIDQAIRIVKLGVDPRYPFVYDPSPRSAKALHQRRRVIPTLDFVHLLAKRIKTPNVQTLMHVIDEMQHWHAKHNANVGIRQPNHRNHVAGWTTHKYRLVQNKRRGAFETSKLKAWISRMLGKKSDHGLITFNLDPKNTVTSNSINNAVSRHMREHTLRVPDMPLDILKSTKKKNTTKNIDPPKYLFRGVHGPIAKALRRYGTYHDKGFVATSVRTEIANSFKAGSGLMMVFKIEDLPIGTPWIWFSPHASPQSHMVPSYCDEAEVLLPPGTYTLTQKVGKNTYVATYRLDRAARSLKGNSIM